MKSPNYPSNYDNNKHVTFPLEVLDVEDDDDAENDDDDDKVKNINPTCRSPPVQPSSSRSPTSTSSLTAAATMTTFRF